MNPLRSIVVLLLVVCAGEPAPEPAFEPIIPEGPERPDLGFVALAALSWVEDPEGALETAAATVELGYPGAEPYVALSSGAGDGPTISLDPGYAAELLADQPIPL